MTTDKKYRWYYIIGSLLVITGAVFQIFHLPYYLALLIAGFVIGEIGLLLDNKAKSMRIKELEEQLERQKA